MKKEISNAFGNVFLTLEYDDDNRWLASTWIGYLTNENVVEGGNACIYELEANNCTLMLNDNQQVVGPWDHAIDWIVQDWTPRAINAGLTHFAHVVDPESFAAISAEMMQTQISHSFQMRIFCNPDEARSWLLDAKQNATISG